MQDYTKTINKVYPLISICVINYNSSDYIHDCIESILNQTYPNIEIVFCDDSSTDDSVDIFESMIKDIETITINRQYSMDNKGVEKNMLNGLRTFTGDYVCNVDCDDVLAINHIETLYRLIDENDVDISCTNHITFSNYNDRKLIKSDFKASSVKLISAVDALPTFFLGEQVLPFAYWHRLYKSEYARNIKSLPDFYFKNSDSAFSVFQFMQAKSVAYLDVATYLYRTHDKSVSHKSWLTYLRSKTLGSLDDIANFYSSHSNEIIELNQYRNLKTIALILGASIDEGNSRKQFNSIYKQYINESNRNAVFDILGIKRKIVAKSPSFVYYYLKKHKLRS